MHVFMSFADAHTGKNIGCCIVEVDEAEQANAKCAELGLMPNRCNHAKGYVLENAADEPMEVNRFYTKDELIEMGYELG